MPRWLSRGRHDTEDSRITELSEHHQPRASGGAIVTVGAVIGVLLGIPCVIMGLFALVGFITGDTLIAGLLGVMGIVSIVGEFVIRSFVQLQRRPAFVVRTIRRREPVDG